MDFVVLTPFWAVWPFETMIAPKRHMPNILDMNDGEILQYAEAISVITRAYDKLFNTSFPYSSGIHQAPTDGNIKHTLALAHEFLSTIIKKCNS